LIEVVVMEFRKRHDTSTQQTFACANLLQTCHLCYGLVSTTTGKSPTCYGLATGKL